MEYILGAGGLADEVYAMIVDYAEDLEGFCVTAEFIKGARTHGLPLCILEELLKKEWDNDPKFYRAIGESRFFMDLHRKFKFQMESFWHPSAFVSKIAKVGEGVMVGPFADLLSGLMLRYTAYHALGPFWYLLDAQQVWRQKSNMAPELYAGDPKATWAIEDRWSYYDKCRKLFGFGRELEDADKVAP